MEAHRARVQSVFDIVFVRGRKRHVCVSVPKECVSVYCTKGLYCRFIQYVRISGFVQSR